MAPSECKTTSYVPGGPPACPWGEGRRLNEGTCPVRGGANTTGSMVRTLTFFPSPWVLAKPVHMGPQIPESGDLGLSQAPHPFPWDAPQGWGFRGPLPGGPSSALDSQGAGLSSSEVTSGSMSFSLTFSVRSLKSFTSSWSRSLMTALFWLAVEDARSWPLEAPQT